jgi:microcystin-dependent protein
VSTPYISEIRMMSFNFAPKGWAMCNGQLLPINQNQALFSLLGTTYGGDGRVNFALPNLQGRVPLHMGNGYTEGQSAGEQAHVLTIGEDPVHTHTAYGTPTDADIPTATGNYLGAQAGTYGPPTSPTTLVSSTVGNAGGSQPHDNMQPYLTLTFCIALQGVFPSQN